MQISRSRAALCDVVSAYKAASDFPAEKLAKIAMTQLLEDLALITAKTFEHYNEHAAEFWEGTRDHDVKQNIEALQASAPRIHVQWQTTGASQHEGLEECTQARRHQEFSLARFAALSAVPDYAQLETIAPQTSFAIAACCMVSPVLRLSIVRWGYKALRNSKSLSPG